MKRCALFLWLLLSGAPAHAAPSVEAQAKALEQRLLAPCCWTQTLDVHESPLVTEMRLEIRDRLTAGETPLAIEDTFAQQHGERVRAMPRGQNPMTTYVQWIGAALLLALALLIVLARTWTQRTTRHASTIHTDSTPHDSALDEELNRALARIE